MSATKAAAPRVAVVMPGEMPALMAAMATGDTRAAQRVQPVLNLVAHIRSKKDRGSTCPCCRGKVSGRFATALTYKGGSAEPSLAAAICADCAGTTEEATAAGQALARRVWRDG